MEFIKSIDIFRTSFKLNISNSDSYKTILGGVFTLILASATLVLLWVFGNDMYLKESPKVILGISYRQEDPTVNLEASKTFSR